MKFSITLGISLLNLIISSLAVPIHISLNKRDGCNDPNDFWQCLRLTPAMTHNTVERVYHREIIPIKGSTADEMSALDIDIHEPANGIYRVPTARSTIDRLSARGSSGNNGGNNRAMTHIAGDGVYRRTNKNNNIMHRDRRDITEQSSVVTTAGRVEHKPTTDIYRRRISLNGVNFTPAVTHSDSDSIYRRQRGPNDAWTHIGAGDVHGHPDPGQNTDMKRA